jgi:hypothetical protein
MALWLNVFVLTFVLIVQLFLPRLKVA